MPQSGNEQDRVLDFLIGQGAARPFITTHISIVALTPQLAWKLKRAVRLPYLDFSTPERRLAACERELELNRRTAPGIYRSVRRITAAPGGGLAFDGDGPLIDAVVEMNRFEQDRLLDALADRGALARPVLTALARTIAQFHSGLPAVDVPSGAAILADVLRLNHRSLAGNDVFDPVQVAGVENAIAQALGRLAPLLDVRAANGKVRRCHGDLHLRNICLIDESPVLFDCIEFDDGLATIDILYDLAFLLMDLWHRGDGSGANWILNRYLDAIDEADGLPALATMMSLRAVIRAHVLGTQAAGDPGSAMTAAAARSYLDLAESLALARAPHLVAIGGLSGTGKSSVAAGLAAQLGNAPGARVLSSDRIRKKLHGVSAETRLPPPAYAPEVSARVYAEAAREADRLLAQGGAVVMDAVFDRPQDRARLARLAQDRGVAFTGIWLTAAPDVLRARVGARRGDPSDADLAVLDTQLAGSPTAPDWQVIDAGRDLAAVVADIEAVWK